ncbi:unnamed protein product [Mycena citricolor]|uniref:Uncharacterized protein n=1 Tax=Mycena citricolor TaxID=2018698 RepID=A0AAD2GS89_9AGAR|nr:unnamed protein product [Mycena citricolor]CAK5275862.1 unnamed protein product [Mycena citricolor]
MRLNRSRTFSGFKSSNIGLFTCTKRSFWNSTAVAKVFLNASNSGAVFFARNLSWMIFSGPTFFTVPFVAAQYGQCTTLRAIVLTALEMACRWMFSRLGRRNRLM